MKLSDLINLYSEAVKRRNLNDQPYILALGDFIKMVNNQEKEQLDKPDIYALTSFLKLFHYHEEKSFHSPFYVSPPPLLGELRKLVIQEMAPLTNSETDYRLKQFAFNSLLRALVMTEKEGLLTQENFISLLGSKNPHIVICTLDTFSILNKVHLLNSWSRKIVINVFSNISNQDALEINRILCYLATSEKLNIATFQTVLNNKYKSWHINQGYALKNLYELDLEVYLKCKDYILRDAEISDILSRYICDLYRNSGDKLPQILTELAHDSENAAEIIEKYHKKLIGKSDEDIEFMDTQIARTSLFADFESAPVKDLTKHAKSFFPPKGEAFSKVKEDDRMDVDQVGSGPFLNYRG